MTTKRKKVPSLAFFKRMGRLGGKLGGKALAASRTPEERREAARHAVAARWARAREKKARASRSSSQD